jgi:hypothetical protein
MENNFTLNDLVIYAIEHNGGTFNPDSLEPVESNYGYAVSINGASQVEHTLDALTVNGYLTRYADELEGLNRYFGLWRDSGGLWYFDVSIIVDNEKVAKELADEEGQIAYYDFKEKAEKYIVGLPSAD